MAAKPHVFSLQNITRNQRKSAVFWEKLLVSLSFISHPSVVLRHRLTDISYDKVFIKAYFDKLNDLEHFSNI